MNIKINIGLSETQRKEIVDGLNCLLADTYTLYLKTHNFHWNVTGPLFKTLHLMFEEQYAELAVAADTIAERIRTLGFPAPGSYVQFNQFKSIEEETGVPAAEAMIQQLLEGNEAVVRTARNMFDKAANAHDEATVELLTSRIEIHEKAAWMLRSMLI